jgi:hypothetical protein
MPEEVEAGRNFSLLNTYQLLICAKSLLKISTLSVLLWRKGFARISTSFLEYRGTMLLFKGLMLELSFSFFF